ncbi:MAG: hypothetical protein PG978_000100 [Wolbachia endosymbiont of Ctenocephalides felis wCfeF]|nr:MAG: hypothetical protein PG978_000100 [Wolbachia endosymbiont of Ctenocephalides felis wCfeF]
MNAVVGPGGVIGLTNGGSGKKEPIAVSSSVKEGKFFSGTTSGFNVPLSIFRYKGYDSDFFTSWYNILREIFEEIKEMCPEKRVLNLALSVLMLPYIASVSLGLVVYNRSKADGKIQASPEGNETKKSEVSESTAKRLAYSVLAAIAILVNIVVLVTLIIPATLALATFYLSNKKLSHSLIATVKIGSGLYKNEHQNIEVSFHEMDAGESDIRWDMEIKFPPQFEQLLRDLCEDKNDKLFVTQDAEHNIILKLSANIHLKNGLVPLRNEIRGMLATSIQGFTEAMEKLLKSDKKDITKLKELLNEFRLKAVNSVDPKLTSHLIQDAYRVALIQAIKIAQQRRKEGFSLEERLKEVLVEQELRSQGKELPTEKEMILKDLGISNNLDDKTLPSFRAKRRKLITERKIAEKKVIDVYKDKYPKETAEALRKAEVIIKELKGMEEKRYEEICEELRKIHGDVGKNNLKDGALKRKLEDLFKFEPTDQYVYRELIKSRIRKAEVMLNQSDLIIDIKQSLLSEFRDLNVDVCSHHEINLLLEKMHSEITKCKTQSLFQEQGKSIKDIEDNTGILMLFNGEDEKRLVKKIVSYREEIRKCLTQPARVKEIIEKQNKDLDIEKNSEEKESLAMELIELCLKNNQEILKALEDLESEKEGLLINEKTEYDYKEELTSREKIKFAIIEDDLLEIFKQKTFNEEEIKKLLEKAELEYCLAERCIKYPTIKTKDNIKHFCQTLLSPLIDNLVEKIINNVPKNISKDTESNWTGWDWIHRKVIKPVQITWNYNMLGLSAIGGKNSTEGKALDVAHDTYKEVDTLLKYFESSYEEVGGLIGNVFSDDGETFKKDIWPEIKNHLLGMWDRFSKDVEFTLISKDKNINQETVNTELGQFTIQKHNSIGGLVAGA